MLIKSYCLRVYFFLEETVFNWIYFRGYFSFASLSINSSHVVVDGNKLIFQLKFVKLHEAKGIL